jgi:hypothetical protein
LVVRPEEGKEVEAPEDDTKRILPFMRSAATMYPPEELYAVASLDTPLYRALSGAEGGASRKPHACEPLKAEMLHGRKTVNTEVGRRARRKNR